jgi:hypothetical protein
MDDIEFFACGHPVLDRVFEGLRALPDASTGYRMSSQVPSGVWVEVIREVTSRVGPGTGRLVRHLVGSDGHVISSLLDDLPLEDVPVSKSAPLWANEAVRASEAVFREEFEAFVAEARVQFDTDQIARRERLERIYESQHDRLSQQIDAEESWLAARRVDPSDRDRKILPARERKVELARERLAELKDELELETDRLIAEQPTIKARVLSAAVVEGL